MDRWKRYRGIAAASLVKVSLYVYYNVQIVVNGLLCAGKKIHEALLDAGNAGIENIAACGIIPYSVYAELCQLIH